MIDFDATVAKAQSFDTVMEARKWILTILNDLVELKQSPGGDSRYKNLIRQIVEPFHGKGKGDFLKSIEGYIKEAEFQQRQAKFAEATDDTQRELFDTDNDGVVTATQANIVKILENNKYLEFQLDTFSERRLFRFKGNPILPEGLEKYRIEVKYPEPHRLTGSKVNRWYSIAGCIHELKLYLHQFFPEERRWFELEDAIKSVTERNRFNIYQDYMDNGLPEWTCDERMDFLWRYAGVEDRQWAIAVGYLIFMTLIARCYDPGFDIRGTPILEGDENIGKTWLCKSIPFNGEESYIAFEFNKNSNDYEPTRILTGATVVELADKGGMENKSADHIKAFLTKTHDVNRRMRMDEIEKIKRLFITIVTCNETSGLLKGAPGEDTRFWPVHCKGKINVQAIIAELPQLYAQAKYLYERGISPRPTESEMEMQRKYVAPRQEKPTYYYYILEKIKLHQKQIVVPDMEWDEGFTMDEMLTWMEQEPWFTTKSRTQHLREIAKILKSHFHFDNVVRAIPVFFQTEGGAKTVRKWRYISHDGVDWNTYLSTLDD